MSKYSPKMFKNDSRLLKNHTLNELWTRVSSRSITMHFLSASSGLKSGNKAFWGALEALFPLLSMTSPVLVLALTSLSLFLCLELRLPRQQIIEHKKLDERFLGGSERKYYLFTFLWRSAKSKQKGPILVHLDLISVISGFPFWAYFEIKDNSNFLELDYCLYYNV